MNGRTLGTVLVSAVLILGLAAWGQTVAAPQRTLDISIIDVEPFPYCAISHTGPYSEIGLVIQELVGAMEAQGLLVRIGGPMVGVYYNSPQGTRPEDLSWDLGFIVEAQTTTRPPLMLKSWDHRTVAAALYVGPYDQAGAAIGMIMAWLEAKGYDVAGPVLERYLDQNPSAVAPDKLRTEIWIPCSKR